ncbi:VanZ family protein [bacterium LRH843]|nr:VanZ family protein [bacterium LRH843]
MITTIMLLIVWAAIMGYMSAQTYSQQDVRPMLRNFDLSWVESLFGWVNFTYSSGEISVAARGPAGFIEFFIRKGAHVTVFATLGFLCVRLLTLWSGKMFVRVGVALLLVVFAASIDEFRHFLNPGRSGLVEDVVLDTCGGAIGIAIHQILHRLKARRRRLEGGRVS